MQRPSTLLCEAGRASSFSSNRVSCGFRAAWICSRCSRRISFQSYCLPSRRNKRRHGDRPQERRNIWRSEKLQRRERGNPGSRDQNKRREDRRGRNSAGRACDRCMRAGPSRELPDRGENTPISLRPQGTRRAAAESPASMRERYLAAAAVAATSSVTTLKPASVQGPNDVTMATSVASRPRAIRMRPIRGVLWRASKVYQRPPR